MKHVMLSVVLSTVLFFISGVTYGAEEYSRADKLVLLCFECHTADNNTPDLMIPKLTGQNADYLVAQILHYKSGRRVSTVMMELLEDARLDDIKAIAEYFSTRPPMSGTKIETELSIKGKDVYLGNNCHFCHGMNGNSVDAFVVGAPLITGQNKDYLYKTMKDMQAQKRPVDMFDLMQKVLLKLSNDELEALSEYINSL